MPIPASATIPLPRIKFAKKQQRSQVFMIDTQEGRTERLELPVNGDSAVHIKSHRAFIVDPMNQYKDEDGVMIQFADERCCVPVMDIYPRTKEEIESIINSAYHNTTEESIMEEFESVRKSDFMNKLLWIVGMPTVAFTLIYFLQYLKK